ncbi:MAG: hypothetical protein ACI8PZ_001362 [Myxococcota bacterium]|jgi:hypothetical protein
MQVEALFAAGWETSIVLEHPFIDAGDQLVLLGGIRGLGEGPCFGLGGVNCIDVREPRLIDTVFAAEDGRAEFLVEFPVRPETEVSLQAWRLGGFGYVASSSWTAETWVAVEYILGCTDPEAPEYDPEATVDDGSCTVTGIEFGAYRWLLGPRGSNCLGVCETIGRGCADLVADDFSETADDNICSRFFPDLPLDADGDGPRLSNTDADGLPTDSSSCVYRDHNWGGWSCEWVERDADVRMCPCE